MTSAALQLNTYDSLKIKRVGELEVPGYGNPGEENFQTYRQNCLLWWYTVIKMTAQAKILTLHKRMSPHYQEKLDRFYGDILSLIHDEMDPNRMSPLLLWEEVTAKTVIGEYCINYTLV